MRSIKTITSIFILTFVSLLFISCGGENVRPLATNPSTSHSNPQTDPLVRITFNGFDPETTTLRFGEGQKVTFELDSLDSTITSASLAQNSGPIVNFGNLTANGTTVADGNVMEGNGMNDIRFTLQDVEGSRLAVFPRSRRVRAEFVMPSVTRSTNISFRFQSTNGLQSQNRSIPITIEDDAGAITLSGQVSKGLVSNTRIRLFSVDGFIDDLFGERQIVEPVQIDETGTYSFTLLPAIDFEELLLYKVKADGADMVCDAPQGCKVADFGETFEVEDDLDLRAYIRAPQLGSTQTVNINILTTLTARSAQELAEGFERVDAEDVLRGQQEAARIFGLNVNQDFTKVPFVDITKTITSNDENAIRIAMIGGGVLGATFAHSDPDDDDDYLEELDDFIDDFKKGMTPCQDSPTQRNLSIEDIMKYALDAARINGSTRTQFFFSSRLNGIRNGTIRCNFLSRLPE